MARNRLNSSPTMAEAFENFLFSKSAQGVTDKTLKSYKGHFNIIMEKQKKRSFLTLVRAFLLLFAGYWLVRTAVENALDKVLPTSVIVFSVLGIPMFCLGLYYAYVFIRGDKDNPSDTKDEVSRHLRMLKELYDSGILTEEEYSEKKSKLLDL